jgi:hypothetical protein
MVEGGKTTEFDVRDGSRRFARGHYEMENKQHGEDIEKGIAMHCRKFFVLPTTRVARKLLQRSERLCAMRKGQLTHRRLGRQRRLMLLLRRARPRARKTDREET